MKSVSERKALKNRKRKQKVISKKAHENKQLTEMTYKLMRDYNEYNDKSIHYKLNGETFTFDDFTNQTVIALSKEQNYSNEKISSLLGMDLAKVEEILKIS